MATPGSQWLIENYEILPGNEWSAATNDGSVANNANLDQLISTVRERYADLSHVTFMYVVHEKTV